MDYLYILLVIISSLVIAFGILGIVFPAWPGIPIIFLGILIFGIFTGFQEISLLTIIILAFLMGIGLLIDYFSSTIGAKKLGATRFGIWGGLLGLLIGVLFHPLGFISVIIFPILGTIVGELIEGRKLLESSRSAIGITMGYLAGMMIKFIIASIMLYIFIQAVF